MRVCLGLAFLGVCFGAVAQDGESDFHLGGGVGAMSFHGDGIDSSARFSFEIRGEYDVSERMYVYAGYIYSQADSENDDYKVIPTPPLIRKGLLPIPIPFFIPFQVPDPNPQSPTGSMITRFFPFVIFPPALKILPTPPLLFPEEDEDSDIHIITAGPGFRFEEWERLSLNWDIGAGVVFGDEVDSHLALNTSLGATCQLTNRAELDLRLTGTLTNTKLGNADLDWGWGGHAGVSIALGPGGR